MLPTPAKVQRGCGFASAPSLTTDPNSLELINLPGQPSELLAALGRALGTSHQDKPEQLGLLQGQHLVLKPREGADRLQLWDTAGSVLSMVEHSSTRCPPHRLVLQQG